jgi:hypothetical protein
MKSGRSNQNDNDKSTGKRSLKESRHVGHGRFFLDSNRNEFDELSHIDSISYEDIKNEIIKLQHLNSRQADKEMPSITLCLIRTGNRNIMERFFEKINNWGLYGQYKSAYVIGIRDKSLSEVVRKYCISHGSNTIGQMQKINNMLEFAVQVNEMLSQAPSIGLRQSTRD